MRELSVSLLLKKSETIFTTPNGIGHYYKAFGTSSDFEFVPWDLIQICLSTKGCIKRKLLVVANTPILTNCKFWTSDVKSIIDTVHDRIHKNAGEGEWFGIGRNKVLVTDTHVLCVGKKKFKAFPKPYEDGEFIKKMLLHI